MHARFITEDPIRDGENWFSYVGNNPVNLVDPWGLSASDGQKNGSTGEQILDNIQTTLNIAGLIPGAGEVADVANGFISLARGNYIDAAFSFVSIAPVIGDAIGKGGKTARFIEKSSGRTAGGQKSAKSSKPIEIKPQQSSKSKSANNKRNSSITQEKKYKKPISGSGKEKATDIPSWAKGERPIEGESGKDFARRLMDAKYGEGNYNTREPGGEFNQLKKYGDRGFE